MNKHLSLAIVASMLMLCGFSGCKNKANVVPPKEKIEDTTNVAKDTITTEVDSTRVISIDDLSEPSGYINGHGYVDLGLSVKWATCNVGANSPSDYGDYYAWGETNTKSSYDEENSVTFNKDMGSIAGSSQYDAARVNWGITWRLPIKEEIYELIDESTWEWTTLGGHKGYKVTGPIGNSIFLPAAGWCYGTSLVGREYGSYWSATPYENIIDHAYSLDFVSSGFYRVWSYRDYGQSIRPVSE